MGLEAMSQGVGGTIISSAIYIALWYGPMLTHASDCALRIQAPSYTRLESQALVLAYRFEPPQLRVGTFFAVDVVVCTGTHAAQPIAEVLVDAHMPAHGHGMNYRPQSVAIGPGRFRADGLMLHMPGRWELRFDVRSDGQQTRLSHTFELQE